MKLHIYHYVDDRIHGIARRIEEKLDLIIAQRRRDMATWQEIQDKISANGTLIGSVATAFAELKQKLADAGVPQPALDAAFAGLEANSAALRAITEAVVANTPAANIPVDQPVA